MRCHLNIGQANAAKARDGLGGVAAALRREQEEYKRNTSGIRAEQKRNTSASLACSWLAGGLPLTFPALSLRIAKKCSLLESQGGVPIHGHARFVAGAVEPQRAAAKPET